MNEQNNNVNIDNTQGAQPTVTPSTQPVASVSNATSVSNVEQNAVTAAPVTENVQVAATEPVTQPVVQAEVVTEPVTQPVVQVEVVTEPVTQPVVQQEVAPVVSTEPVSTVPVVEVAPATVSAEVVQNVEQTTSSSVAEVPVQEVVVQEVASVQTEVATEVATQPVASVEAVTPVVTTEPVQVVTEAVNTVPVTEAPAQEVVIEPVVSPAVQQETTPVVTTEPVSTPSTEAVAEVSTEEFSTQPVQTDIVVQEPLNPLANEPATSAPSNTGTIAPSTPLVPNEPVAGAINSNGVGFVAASAAPKKKVNKALIITIVLVVLLGLAALIYFVIYPMIVNKLVTPKKVYETAIRDTFNGLTNTVNEVVHDKAIYDASFYLDSDVDFLQNYSGYTYQLNYGVDPVNEAIQAGFSIKNSGGAGHWYNTYLKDGKEYVEYSIQRDLIYVGEANLDEAGQIFGSFKDMLSNSKKANASDINYVINKVSELLISSLDESKMSKEEASITVNKENIKVINNKYQIDKNVYEKTIKHVLDGLKSDDKVVSILAKVLEKDESKIKDLLTYNEVEVDDEENNDTVITFNIYTTSGLKPSTVGYAITTNQSDTELHYYTVENYSELKFYYVGLNIETNKEETTTFLVTNITSGGKTTVDFMYNDKVIATLNIKDWTDSLKEFDYVISLEDGNITGTVKYITNISKENNKYEIDISTKFTDGYINAVLKFSEDWTSEVAKINVNEAVTLSDDQINEIHSEFMNIVLSESIGEIFQTITGDFSEDAFDYYYEIEDPEEDHNNVIQEEYEYDDETIIPLPEKN